jgi:hypothetical protein
LTKHFKTATISYFNEEIDIVVRSWPWKMALAGDASAQADILRDHILPRFQLVLSTEQYDMLCKIIAWDALEIKYECTVSMFRGGTLPYDVQEHLDLAKAAAAALPVPY